MSTATAVGQPSIALATCATALPQPNCNHGDHHAQTTASRNHVRNVRNRARRRQYRHLVHPGGTGMGCEPGAKRQLHLRDLFHLRPERQPDLVHRGSSHGMAPAYTGGLFATTGTWFATPWQTGNLSVVQAGTASFEPSSLGAHRGTLAYTVNGVATVTKSIERQTLTAIVLGGSYTGGQVGNLFRLHQSRRQSRVHGPLRPRGDSPRKRQRDVPVHVLGEPHLHAVGHARAAWTAIRNSERDLPVLGRSQYIRDAVRDQGDRTGNRGPHECRFGRRRLSGGRGVLRGAAVTRPVARSECWGQHPTRGHGRGKAPGAPTRASECGSNYRNESMPCAGISTRGDAWHGWC